MRTEYDSTHDTQEHIEHVRALLAEVIKHFKQRQLTHDTSKLAEPEKSMYDEFVPRLREATYGSDEYKSYLVQMGAALQHHYEVNSHHPEHYANGVNDMSLIDIVEMLADWKAAAMRSGNGSILPSLDVNRQRFALSDQLFEIIQNTVKAMGW